MAESSGKQEQWDDYDPAELRAVAGSILYLARRTGQRKEEDASSNSPNRESKD